MLWPFLLYDGIDAKRKIAGSADLRTDVSPDSEQIEPTKPQGFQAKLCERGASPRQVPPTTFLFFFTNKGLIMYEFLTLLQFVIIIVFGISVFVIYQHGFIQSKVLNSGACNELAIAILVFAVLQLLISYLLKKFSKK